MGNNYVKICLCTCVTVLILLNWCIYVYFNVDHNTIPVPAMHAIVRKSLDIPATQTQQPSNMTKEGTVVEPTCKPVQRIVYIKTHKTAGTTLSTIIQRYGYTRNLTFAIPVENSSVFNCYNHFKGKYVYRYTNHRRIFEWGKSGADFHLFSSHAVYNRPELEVTVPGALYITSLRDPVEQFESAFVYFEMAKQAGIASTKNPLATFLSNPGRYRRKIHYGRPQIQNGQLYDLGLINTDYSNPFTVKNKIEHLDGEFDLVVIAEYFDESLILLKKMLCWEMDDILYISKRARQSKFRTNMTDSIRLQIRQWNRADVLLYQHFNRTLWRKIHEYGPQFWRDLQEFRTRVAEITSICSPASANDTVVIKDDKHHINIVKLTNGSQMCMDLYRYDGEYTNLIRKKMALNEPTKTITNSKTNSSSQINRNVPLNQAKLVQNLQKTNSSSQQTNRNVPLNQAKPVQNLQKTKSSSQTNRNGLLNQAKLVQNLKKSKTKSMPKNRTAFNRYRGLKRKVPSGTFKKIKTKAIKMIKTKT